MANLVEQSQWENGIYQLETLDPVEGGPNGIDNLQAKQLGNRTLFLKGLIESAQNALAGHNAAADPHPQYLTTAEGNSLIATAVSALVNSSPATLDTLNELAAALGNDPNFATTITTALGNKQPIDQTLTALAALATAANKLIYATGADTFSTTDFTAFARTLLDDSDAATMRSTLMIDSGFVYNFVSTNGSSGYIKFPNWLGGFIIQFGNVSFNQAENTFSLPLAYPNQNLGVYAIAYKNPNISASGYYVATVAWPSKTSFTLRYGNDLTGNATQWLSIGY